MNAPELEYRLLYSMVVAGKSAIFAENCLARLFRGESQPPFAWIRFFRSRGLLGVALRNARTGNYGKLEKGFSEAADSMLDLSTCTPDDLMRIHGVGPKTAKFFIIWTRPEADFAALDTHVLKWLRHLGHDAPMSTPSGEKYTALEKIVLAEAKARGMTARELDAAIWDWCSTGRHKGGEWPEGLRHG